MSSEQWKYRHGHCSLIRRIIGYIKERIKEAILSNEQWSMSSEQWRYRRGHCSLFITHCSLLGWAFLKNFDIVEQKIAEVEAKDHIRNFQPPVTGDDIMELYNIPPGRIIGDIKERIKEWSMINEQWAMSNESTGHCSLFITHCSLLVQPFSFYLVFTH